MTGHGRQPPATAEDRAQVGAVLDQRENRPGIQPAQWRHTAPSGVVIRAASATVGMTASPSREIGWKRRGREDSWRMTPAPDALSQAALRPFSATDAGATIAVARYDHANRARHLCGLLIPLHGVVSA